MEERPKPKLVRITTVPKSLWKLLEGQLEFMSNDFDVIAISSSGKRMQDLSDRLHSKLTVEMHRGISPLKDLIAIFNLYKIFRHHKPEIVHSHTPKAGFVGMAAAKLAGVPIKIHTVAGLPLQSRTGFIAFLLKLMEKVTYLFADTVWPNSFGIRDYISENKMCRSQKLHVIGKGSSNGINLDHFSSNAQLVQDAKQIRNENGIKNGEKVFGFIGRIVKDKGINELLVAFDELSKLRSDIHLFLIGDYESDLDPIDPVSSLILKTSKNIHFLGYQNDVRPYYLSFDYFVFPSYREGLPNVILQAGAMGLPILATKIDGTTDIISNHENGLLVDARSKDQLKDGMETLLGDNDLIAKFKSNVRQSIEKKYSRNFVWEEIKKQYNLLLSDGIN